MFSSRHADTLKGLVEELGPLARVGTVAEAVEFGDVVMVVVPYTAMEQPHAIDIASSLIREIGFDPVVIEWPISCPSYTACAAMMPACAMLDQTVNEIRLRFSEGLRAAAIR
jgi:hypothetical protein